MADFFFLSVRTCPVKTTSSGRQEVMGSSLPERLGHQIQVSGGGESLPGASQLRSYYHASQSCIFFVFIFFLIFILFKFHFTF